MARNVIGSILIAKLCGLNAKEDDTTCSPKRRGRVFPFFHKNCSIGSGFEKTGSILRLNLKINMLNAPEKLVPSNC